MIAIPTLAALAAAVGNAFRIQLKPTWTEASTLWGVVVAPSGSGKSPSMDAALRPILDLERASFEKYEAELTAYEAELADFQTLPKKEQRRASKPTPPLLTRYRVGDTTVESLGAVLGDNSRGVLLARDELAGWFGSFDRYASGSGDLQAWIEMHGGKPTVIDRKSSRNPVIRIDRPSVNVSGTIQPEVLRDQMSKAHFASGFAARLLFCEPPTRLQRWTEATVAPEVTEGYKQLIHGLYAFPCGDETDVLTLHPHARDFFVAFYDENRRLAFNLPNGPLRSALMKLEAMAARLALVFAVAEAVQAGERPTEVSLTAMVRACRLATWLRYETARIYEKYGFERAAMSRDKRLALSLSESFGYTDVKEVWQVGTSAAYKVIERLIEARLAEDATHGAFTRLVDPASHTVNYHAFFPSWAEEKTGV